MCVFWTFFFVFFQAEDGIRDSSVTGVQTCALPIFHLLQDLDCIVLNGAVPRFLVAHFAGAARLYHIVSERDQLDIDAGLPERFRALFDHHLGVAVSPGTPVYRQNLHDTVAPVSRESEQVSCKKMLVL